MAYRDLHDFVRTLEKKGEFKRISAEVDPVWKSPKSPTVP